MENGDGCECVNRPLKQGAQVGPDAAPWLEIWTVAKVLRHLACLWGCLADAACRVPIPEPETSAPHTALEAQTAGVRDRTGATATEVAEIRGTLK